MYADIAVALPFDAIYTYAIPDKLASAVVYGVRVVVPDGTREMTGFVLKV